GGVADSLFATLNEEPDRLVGTGIGPYHLEERIGQGGMGDVYRARRADGLFDREVALKVVRRGAEIGSVLSRFAAERRILGRLRHPGIARLLDAGIEDGRPWIAMDYVEGETITAVARGLPVPERVRLLIAVAEAVHTAHQSLVVHRDLKPSNVLVSRDASGALRPVLLDFGIAKILDPDEADDLTRVDGRRPMTHTYAAPEQIRGETPTTATDVYGLGLLAYEVLTGERPFPDPGSRTKLERAILDDDPAPPSTVAASGDTDAAPEARALRGDLDTICLKALRKEPTERYASAEAFAADLRRHLDHLPIDARPPSASYRIARFVRRHRVGVAAATAALLATIALSGIYATSLARERDRARTEAETAAQVADLMAEMFDRDPFAAEVERLDTLRVGAFLVQRGGAVIDGLGDQPRVQARLATLLSHLHVNLGDFDVGRPLAERAVAIVDSLGARGPDASEAYTALASVQSYLGEYEASEQNYRTALALAEEAFPPGHPSIAESVNNLAYVLPDVPREGAGDEAIELGRRALRLSREALGDDHLDVAQTHNNLGAYLYTAGRGDEAAAHYRRALEIREAALGRHPLVANTLSNLANLVHEQGDPEAAIPLFERAISIWRDALGPEHPSLAIGHYGLGDVYRDLRRLSEAERSFRAAMRIDQASFPEGHPYILDSMISIAQVQTDAGRFADAEGLLREALGFMDGDTPEASRAVAVAALGLSLLRQRRAAEAEPLLRGALPHLDDGARARVEGHLAEALAAR
ncbi:MAG: serine/threonine-protein kinase, partial [Bacteroidota bacterium]